MKGSRVTGYVKRLKENEVFVFGSNLSGRHGNGAAKTALKWGAVLGQGEGIAGQTWALPTKAKDFRRTLSLKEIRQHVNRFLTYAVGNPDTVFHVTEIGCGLAGLKPEEIAPMFVGAMELENVKLPKRFWSILETED